MDKREAKEILLLYRPGIKDDHDPRLAEALRLAQQDAELGEWFAGHCRLFTAMRSRLKEIAVPVDLSARILREDAVRRGKIVPLRSRLRPLAAAAMVALLAVALWSFFGREDHRNNFAAYRERIVKQSQRGYAMSMTSTDLQAIRSFLLAKQCPDYVLTKPLAQLPGEGCTTLEWHDRKVSMVCLNGGQGRDLFLFVMDRASLPQAPVAGSAEFVKNIHRLMTASWAAGDKVYILAGPGDEAALKQYLD